MIRFSFKFVANDTLVNDFVYKLSALNNAIVRSDITQCLLHTIVEDTFVGVRYYELSQVMFFVQQNRGLGQKW